MEGLEMNRDFWRKKRVFVTGHTGFKGAWLALWLSDMGAEVHGYALPAPTDPSFFELCKVKERLESCTTGDVRDIGTLSAALHDSDAEIVFHLAAQSLVRESYTSPVETFAVNVMGTVNLLECIRHAANAKAVVNVTTDKCYENREWLWPYRESEALGGHDPYSSSKGCAELVTAAYRRSFLGPAGVPVASARAGNVIGGGDWAPDRLIPDFVKALHTGRKLLIRSPASTRPWQHVLEPLCGYMTLAERLYSGGGKFAEPWNFGPDDSDAQTVEWIVKRLCDQVPGAAWEQDPSPQPHEANYLKLDSSNAKARLGWRPRWDLGDALGHTLSWYEAWRRGADMAQVSLDQIGRYESGARR